MMKNKIVTIFGGSGFLGRYVVRYLAEQGALIRVPSSNVSSCMHLLPLGGVGQIRLTPCDIRNAASVESAIRGADYVVNLVGIFYEKGVQTFEAMHVTAARIIVQLAVKHHVARLIHVSALGGGTSAREQSLSRYADSKSRGEAEVREAYPEAIILRPSAIFGAEDRFLNKFAHLMSISPIIPLIGGGYTRFQPVYVGDVAKAILRCLAMDKEAVAGQIYELGGSHVFSFKELMVWLSQQLHRSPLLVPVPFAIAQGMGAVMQILPTPPLTVDQVKLLKSDSVVAPDSRSLIDLNIPPQSLNSAATEYLDRHKKRNL